MSNDSKFDCLRPDHNGNKGKPSSLRNLLCSTVAALTRFSMSTNEAFTCARSISPSAVRSEERRVGKERVRNCSSVWSAYTSKKKIHQMHNQHRSKQDTKLYKSRY